MTGPALWANRQRAKGPRWRQSPMSIKYSRL